MSLSQPHLACIPLSQALDDKANHSIREELTAIVKKLQALPHGAVAQSAAGSNGASSNGAGNNGSATPAPDTPAALLSQARAVAHKIEVKLLHAFSATAADAAGGRILHCVP